MIYQLRVNIYVKDLSELDDVIDKLEDLSEKAQVVNPGQENEECSVFEVIKNHHDENPNGACEIISHWDNATGG